MKQRSGFTLVELSIVLVIIGLLIGGILVGQSLIGSTKLQAQVRQLQQLDIATQTFITKFNQLPGDANFGGAHGNNDGWIGQSGGDDQHWACNTGTGGECQYFFADLYNIIGFKEPYSGGSYKFGKGFAFPSTVLGKGGIVVSENGNKEVFWIITGGGVNSTTNAGGAMALENIVYEGLLPVFTPTDALALDTKLDDSIPISGTVGAVDVTASNSQPYIFSLATGAGTTYNITSPNVVSYKLQVKANITLP